MLSNCNHKTLGLYYLWFALIFGIFGTACSIIIRLELYSSGLRTIAPENQNFYNLSFTLHGLLMIFFNVQPGLFGGFGNYFVPVLNAAPEVAFPRINSISLLLMPISYGCLLLSTASEFGGGPGWTLYPPLSTSLMSLSPLAVDVIVVGLALSGLSSFLSSINFLTTIFHLRSKGFTLGIIPFNSWAIILTSIMLISTLPVLSGALFMLVSDLHFNTLFYDPAFAGDPVFYQHLFWFFGHPEVYILIIPGFAIISQIISTSYNKVIFGNQSMILAMGCISVLGSIVWAHHMMTVGLEADTRAYFTAVTILISLPTGTKVFNWISTYMGSMFGLSMSSSLFALCFVFTFTLGGTTGVVLGNAAVDIALHDTYYVIAHFHFVLSLGAILALLAGICSFQDTFLGRALSLNSIVMLFCLVFITGILMTFIPMHFLGFSVMPRRIPDYPDNLNGWNYICSLGSGMVVFGTALLQRAKTNSETNARLRWVDMEVPIESKDSSSRNSITCYPRRTFLPFQWVFM
uniref:Cytochrome c oxidase subunit 1 n=1 Tax=Klossia helicina TaxID=1072566 RepID=A0A8K1M5K6_9APIC|nr:cytochrome c oxidase subunit I [Klossia helicina]UBN07449.1 cytochrome c oxidase subunit I [Klossia helicina]